MIHLPCCSCPNSSCQMCTMQSAHVQRTTGVGAIVKRQVLRAVGAAPNPARCDGRDCTQTRTPKVLTGSLHRYLYSYHYYNNGRNYFMRIEKKEGKHVHARSLMHALTMCQ